MVLPCPHPCSGLMPRHSPCEPWGCCSASFSRVHLETGKLALRGAQSPETGKELGYRADRVAPLEHSNAKREIGTHQWEERKKDAPMNFGGQCPPSETAQTTQGDPCCQKELSRFRLDLHLPPPHPHPATKCCALYHSKIQKATKS